MRRECAALFLAIVASGIASCGSRPSGPTSKDVPAENRSAAGHAPTPSHSALHNLHKVSDRLYTGAQPTGDSSFEELKRMGVRTIISVDGSTPDVAGAAAHGLRYVHVPVTYATVTDEQRLEIARAIRDLPGPVFVHCHHGKHRGPAAAAAAAITLGFMTNEQGTVFINDAGTAPSYAGLYACVAEATAASKEELDRVPDYFPSVKQASGVTGAMVEIDLAWSNLGEIKAAGWRTPAEHPDLVPAAEAGRVTDNFRIAHEDSGYMAREHLPTDFVARLKESVALASALEEALVRNAGAAELDPAYTALQRSCKDCHVKYRDQLR